MEKNSSFIIKREIIDESTPEILPASAAAASAHPMVVPVIDLSSSDSESGNSSEDDEAGAEGSSDANQRPKKKKKIEEAPPNVVLPLGFLEPLPRKKGRPSPAASVALALPARKENAVVSVDSNCKQFWKAGDFEGAPSGEWELSAGGIDHVRVHPRFLHSNATSHKWVLGAFAELLDNSLDEISNGATYVNIDMIKNKKDGSRMLLIEDNGGGMDPDRMRQCMSLGYSAKSKMANTIGQYGNGFKTSTMRLGGDVIVFSRSCGKDGRSTESIGLLSYTFLRITGKEDIVVPMLDYEREGQEWNKIIRSTAGDWSRNVETIVQWSPFTSEADLLRQFDPIKDHGTRIIIYNLWEDDQAQLELDFDADLHDIQIRGVNRDEKKIEMAWQYPNSRHFLTYRHSLRSYASILYLRIQPGFRIILRGKDVEHHNIVNDMMMAKEVTYRPQPGADGVPRDSNMVAVVTVGFVKDAKSHIDVQGFNVYHKNRLIKPFWRVWHPPGSDGRGVIGVLEANFVEPAHDKQGFERTIVLTRLEAKLVQMQKEYWSNNCHRIGYAPRRNKKSIQREDSPETPRPAKSYTTSAGKNRTSEHKFSQRSKSTMKDGNGLLQKGKIRCKMSGKVPSSSEPSSPSAEDVSDDDMPTSKGKTCQNGNSEKSLPSKRSNEIVGYKTTHSSPVSLPIAGEQYSMKAVITSDLDAEGSIVNGVTHALNQLKDENRVLRERLRRKEEEILGDLLKDLDDERAKCNSFKAQLQEATQKILELNKEQESLIDIFSEERQRRDIEEENLRKKLKDSSNSIQELLDRVRQLERLKPCSNGKVGCD